MSEFYKHVQGRENKSINLLSVAIVHGLEGTVDHLLGVHFTGNTAERGEGRENTNYGAFQDALRVIDYVLTTEI